MTKRSSRIGWLALAVLALAVGAGASTVDDEVFIPAAARGAGDGASFWTTDLYVMNLEEEAVEVEIVWLERGADNSGAEGVTYAIEGGATLVLRDVVESVFGMEEADGAILVEVVEDEEDGDEPFDDADDARIFATSRIYSSGGGLTYGQGVVGMSDDAAISADDPQPTYVVGVTDNGFFRANWFALNVTETEDDDEGGEGYATAELMLEVLSTDGDVLASATYTLPPLAPMLLSLDTAGAGAVDDAVVRFTMLEGEALVGASVVDQLSNDPTTLVAAASDTGDDEDVPFTDDFFAERCTWQSTGRNPYWVLDPGFQLVLEGEDEGALVHLEITVLDETRTVDGIETRVIEEREEEDGELVEISRNYFAMCDQTGDVYYFGEEVDIYEDGEIVGHEGAWLAGEDGAVAGIIMPGTALAGARYFQEIAPEVAEDRAMHLTTDATVTVAAGTFDNCLTVKESTPLEPGEYSFKAYAPGVGMIWDDGAELVAYTDPANP